MTNIQLTDMEVDILCHRLEIADVIADCLFNTDEDFTFDDVEFTARTLHDTINATKTLPNASDLDNIDKEVLAEAIEGSTWFPIMQQEYANKNVSSQTFTKAIVSLESVERKIGQLIGRKVRAPRW